MKREQVEMFATLDSLVSPGHPYGKLEAVVDLDALSKPLATLYWDRRRPELGADRAFRMLVLQFLEDVSDREMERLMDVFNHLRKSLQAAGLIREVFTFVDVSALVSKLSTWDDRDRAIAKGLRPICPDQGAIYADKGYCTVPAQRMPQRGHQEEEHGG